MIYRYIISYIYNTKFINILYIYIYVYVYILYIYICINTKRRNTIHECLHRIINGRKTIAAIVEIRYSPYIQNQVWRLAQERQDVSLHIYDKQTRFAPKPGESTRKWAFLDQLEDFQDVPILGLGQTHPPTQIDKQTWSQLAIALSSLGIIVGQDGR